MHSANVLESEYREPVVMASEAVIVNNDEVMRQATVLIRLMKLLDSGGGSGGSYGDLVERIARKLENHLGIWELYLRKDEEELASSSVELDRAMDDREVLLLRRNVGDMGDEEYGLKKAAVDWSIENHRKRKSQMERSVSAMRGLLGKLEPEYVEDIRRFAQDDYQKIRELGLGSELSEMIIGDFSKISESLS